MNNKPNTGLIVVSIVVIFAACIFMLSSCGIIGIEAPPSICDNCPPQDSILCRVANENDLHLESVGALIMGLNMQAIKDDVYGKGDVLNVLGKLERALQTDITALNFSHMAMKYYSKYPVLFVISPYIGKLKINEPLTRKDKDMLIWWIGGVKKQLDNIK